SWRTSQGEPMTPHRRNLQMFRYTIVSPLELTLPKVRIVYLVRPNNCPKLSPSFVLHTSSLHLEAVCGSFPTSRKLPVNSPQPGLGEVRAGWSPRRTGRRQARLRNACAFVYTKVVGSSDFCMRGNGHHE